jgi:nucleoside-diphosphate-sugar epimerase
MNILLTGASGFVGRAMLGFLQTMPDTSIRLAVRTPFIDRADLAAHEQCQIDTIDGHTSWAPALQGIDTIIHLAARVHVMHDHSADPLAAFRAVNTEGTLALARQASRAGVRRMVYVSSIKVLGESTEPGQALTEISPTNPRDPYGISKLEAEQGLRRLSVETGLEVVILRPPLVYGPGVTANFQALMRAVQRGWPLPFGAIQNQRSLVAVDNLVSAIYLCAHHPDAANQTFLVSDQQDLSTPGLVRAQAQALGRTARLLPVPVVVLTSLGTITGRSAAVQRLCSDLRIDSSKISNMLGWHPAVTVQEALRRTAAGLPNPRRPV